ncbi:hypothetical protein [Pseudoalteromonas porphyrae]|uniref:DUF485 domain-containing protein n=1 Tax=Pseudoalteromonas porphyrae TaxID=187330 RepID=A0A0N0LY72_9GAMM|nr:hypothetical protein [Pseudoalteromonas porphyrae]KPH60769.1 hypothetical protein ADS77_15785 [Pseudoalteromonas porphyrae]
MKTVDKKSRLIARIFGLAFSFLLYNLLVVGALSYNSMGREITITASSNPVKFYFGIVWCFVMVLVYVYFGIIAKLKTEESCSK